MSLIKAIGQGSLIKAIWQGDIKTVERLIANGANVRSNVYPLRMACKCGRLEIIKFLLEKGANLHESDDQPLCLAARNGHLEVAKFLLKKGANLHAWDDQALCLATENDHLEVVKLLLKKGATVHTLSDFLLFVSSSFHNYRAIKEIKRWLFPDRKLLYSIAGLVLKDSFTWNLPRKMVDEVLRVLFQQFN